MNCRTIEPLLFAERDGALTAAQRTSLEEHLAMCPACRQAREHLTRTMTAIRNDVASVAVPDVDEEWYALRARIGRETHATGKEKSPVSVFWLGAPLAAAAAVAFAFFFNQTSFSPGDATLVADAASAEYVEAGDADASTMVYVDKESGWLVVWATDANGEASG